MTAPFETAIDDLFGSVLAIDAVYYAGTNTPVAVRLMRRQPTIFSNIGATQIASDTTSFDVRVSEIAKPADGDRIIVGNDTFYVQGAPERDGNGLLWKMNCRPACLV